MIKENIKKLKRIDASITSKKYLYIDLDKEVRRKIVQQFKGNMNKIKHYYFTKDGEIIQQITETKI